MNNKPVAWNEEEFNAIAYSYRSWLASDPKGVSDRYEELVNYVQSIAHPSEHDLGIAEAIGFDKGHEAGRQLGMKQERALWNLSESTQEIEK